MPNYVKLSPEIITIINSTIIDELTARYFYEAAANWSRNYGYEGAEKYFNGEAADETTHYKRLIDFLADYNIMPEFPALLQPPAFPSLESIVNAQYDMEAGLYNKYKSNTARAMALDINVFGFLQWFVNVQDESVRAIKTLIDKINHYKKFDADLILFDEEVLNV